MVNPRRLATDRLVLVTATPQHLLVELEDVQKLGRLLVADIEEGWPPEGCTEPDLRRIIDRLHAGPAELVWRRRYIVQRKGVGPRPRLVGHLRLGGPPTNGTVDIEELALVDARRGQGIEREALAIVIDWVMQQDGVQRVTVDLPDDPGATIGVWSDLKFVVDDETGRLIRTKAAWEADGPTYRNKLEVQPASKPVEGIPKVAREVFDRLMKEPLRDPEDMRRECALYLGMIENAAETNPYVDNILGRDIARVCDALLEAIDETTPEHTRRQIQAAARYFVTEEDGDSDLAIGGLDEDAAVANAVAAHLGRDDLVSDLL